MLKIYDKNHNAIGHISKYKDLKIESEVVTGDKTLSFVYLAKHHNITNEMYVRTKEDEYVVKEVPSTTGAFPQIIAILNLEELQKDMWQTFSVTDVTIDEAVRTVLAGTGWTIEYCDVTKRRNAGMMQVSTLDVIQNLCTAFMCEPVFNTIKKTISFYTRRGEDKGVYFMSGLNLKKLQKKSTSYDYYTRIVPIGQDGLRITDANDGKEYLENYQYSNKILTYIWKDESYTDAKALKEDAELKLEDLSKPTVAYSVDIRDLAAQKKEYSILSYAEGDTVKLIDQETGTMVSQRIKKLVRYPDNPEKNTCEIANTFLTFEELQQKYQAAADIINFTVTSDGRYTGKINVSDILKFEQGIKESETIGAINGSITSLQGDLANIKLVVGEIKTNYISAEEAELKYATIENLNVVREDVHDLNADYATFKSATTDELSAHTARIDTISGDLANYKTVVADELITAKGWMAEGAIGDAQISSVSANKLKAGTIDTALITIAGSDGRLQIADNTMQISDAARVRVQVGKDASGDYTLAVWDKAGNLIWDALGATDKTIQRPIIKDPMVAEDAKIQALKIDYQSFETALTDQGVVISGTVVQVGDKTLNVALSEQTQSISKAQSTADAASTAATDAQSAADTAIEDAQNAQSTADTAKADAKTAQDVADKAVKDAKEAQDSANSNAAAIATHAETLTTHESQIKANEQAISLKVGTQEFVDYKAEVDGEFTSVGNRFATVDSQLSVLQDTIALTVKTTELDNTLKNYSTTAQMEAAIAVSKTAITQSVSETYTTKEEFADLEVGEKNLLLKSKDFAVSDWTYTASKWTKTVDGDGYTILSTSNFGSEKTLWRRLIPTKKLPIEDCRKGVIVSFDFMCDDLDALDNKAICSLQNYNADGTRIGWHEPSFDQKHSDYVDGCYSFDSEPENGKWVRVTVKFTYANCIRLRITTNDTVAYTTIAFNLAKNGSVHFKRCKAVYGNKITTDWTPAPEDAEEEIVSTKTIATQTADKFEWLVASGDSASTFTLTDRMATLIADTISLNGNVKVTGDMLIDGSVTAAKINVGDLFAQDIVATGSITGVTIDTTKGNIGGWNIAEKCLYSTDNVLAKERTLAIQNITPSVFTQVSNSGVNCDIEVVGGLLRVTPKASGSAKVVVSFQLAKGDYKLCISSGYTNYHNDDGICGSYSYTDENGEIVLENTTFEKSTGGSGQDSSYTFDFSIKDNGASYYEVEYEMPSAMVGEVYNFRAYVLGNGKVYTGENPLSGIPENYAIALKDTVNNEVTFPFYLTSDGKMYCSNAEIEGNINAHTIKAKDGYSIYVDGFDEKQFISASSWVDTTHYGVNFGIPDITGNVYVGVENTSKNIVLTADDISIYGGLDIWTGGALIREGDVEIWNNLLINKKIISNLETGSYLNGNKGNAIISSDAAAGAYVMLAKMNATDGVFTIGCGNNAFRLNYTDNDTISSNINELTHSLHLLNSDGDMILTSSNTKASMQLRNDNRRIMLHISEADNAGLYVSDVGDWIVYSAADYDTTHVVGKKYVVIRATGFGIRVGDGFTSGNNVVCPITSTNTAKDNSVYLGASSSRWISVYAKNGSIQTSDERDKNIIGDIDQRYLDLFMDLKPILYRWKDGDDTKTHMGFGAQSTEAAAIRCGIAPGELAAVSHDHWDEPGEDGRTDRYGLNYAEITALTVPVVQQNKKTIQALEIQIETMEYRLDQAYDEIEKLKKAI